MMTMVLYYNGAGLMNNAGSGSNWFTIFVGWISPLRYLNEMAFRRILAGRNEYLQTELLEGLGFDWGVTKCSIALALYLILAVVISCLLLSRLAKH